MNLEDYLEPVGYEVAYGMAIVHDPESELADVCRTVVDLCLKLRTLAIITLLSRGDSDLFQHNLIRSGLARATYLSRLHEAGITGDHHQCSGRFAAVIDAIAGGGINVARDIASLSPRDWMREDEYEDDFCYAQILHSLVSGNSDDGRLDLLFERFNASLEGAEDPRLLVTKAIAGQQQEAFEEAFAVLIQRRQREIESNKKRHQMEEIPVVAERQIYVEGLAILRLARAAGIETDDEYMFCPSLAMQPLRTSFPGE